MAINYMTIDEVEEKTRGIIGKRVRDIIDVEETTIQDTAKGRIGQIVERDYFGLPLNNSSEPDFKNLKLELKVTPYKWVYKGTKVSAKERLVLSMIDFKKDIDHTFYSSDLFKKINNILLILYEHDSAKEQIDFIFSKYYFYDFNKISDKDKLIIINDWNFIINKIRLGKAHELSEGDTFYLGACTKAADGSVTVAQPNNPNIEAKSRAYSFKTTYMTNLLRNEIFKKEKSKESFIKNIELLQDYTFEEIISNMLGEFNGLTLDDLDKIYNTTVNRKSKNFIRTYASLMMNVHLSNLNHLEEFEKADISIKTIRISKKRQIKEDMSFPAFKFRELANEDWEESETRNLFLSKKFLFLIFDEIDNNKKNYRFKGSLLWNVPFNIVETQIRLVWEETQRVLNNTLELNIKSNKVYNSFPGSKFNKYSHIRPHGQNRKDTFPLPDSTNIKIVSTDCSVDTNDIYNGHNFTKQCFWLDKSYIMKILKENNLA